MTNYLLIAIFAAAVFLGSVQTASACSCELPRMGESLKTQVRNSKKGAKAIFTGKVVSIRFSEEKIDGKPVALFSEVCR